jgi:hypothetical protein
MHIIVAGKGGGGGLARHLPPKTPDFLKKLKANKEDNMTEVPSKC